MKNKKYHTVIFRKCFFYILLLLRLVNNCLVIFQRFPQNLAEIIQILRYSEYDRQCIIIVIRYLKVLIESHIMFVAMVTILLHLILFKSSGLFIFRYGRSKASCRW